MLSIIVHTVLILLYHSIYFVNIVVNNDFKSLNLDSGIQFSSTLVLSIISLLELNISRKEYRERKLRTSFITIYSINEDETLEITIHNTGTLPIKDFYIKISEDTIGCWSKEIGKNKDFKPFGLLNDYKLVALSPKGSVCIKIMSAKYRNFKDLSNIEIYIASTSKNYREKYTVDMHELNTDLAEFSV